MNKDLRSFCALPSGDTIRHDVTFITNCSETV